MSIKKELFIKTLSISVVTFVLATAIIGIALPTASEAATYTVTTATDDNGSCDTTDCSFREAVLAANANPGADTIKFSTSTAGTTHTIALTSGSAFGEYDNFYITDELTISGLGVKATVLDGDALDNVFYVDASGTVTFENLTIQNGYSSSGAGMYARSDITLDTVVIRDNEAYSCSGYYVCGGAGGGIHIYDATLDVSNSDFLGNSADNNGGGIYADETDVTISDSTFRDNSGVGGAIAQFESTLYINESQFVQNDSRSYGGAIYSTGETTIANSSFVANEASNSGGALYLKNEDQSIATSTFLQNVSGESGGAIKISSANTEIKNVIMKSNSSVKYGGALSAAYIGSGETVTIYKTTIANNSTSTSSSTYSFGGGGVAFTSLSGDVEITKSTIRNNSSANLGGGINAFGGTNGTVDIQSSTISENSAVENGGGIWTDSDVELSLTRSTISGNTSDDNGGGVYAENDAYIAASTIVYNTADNDGDSNGEGGGVFADSTATVYIKNSLLQLNTNTAAPDCSGALQSDDYNVVGSTTGCSYTTGAHDTVGKTQRITVLADNGGPTKTHAIVPPTGGVMSGPAFNIIPLASCTDYTGRLLKRDQRGSKRHGKCDVGSYEY